MLHVPLHPLEECEDRVGRGQPLVRGRLRHVIADDAEGEGHPLQGRDGVLVGHVVAGEQNADSETFFFKYEK